jgi:hypothetical protein
MTNHRRSFKSREAAEDYQMLSSIDPAYCVLHHANRGSIFVRDPVYKAAGRVHVYSYKAKRRDGQMGTFYASYVGA